VTKKLTSDIFVDQLKNNKESRDQFIKMVKTESTAEQITTFAAMFPKTKLQEDFALFVALDKVGKGGWVDINSILKNFEVMSEETGIVRQEIMEEKLKENPFIDKTIVKGLLHFISRHNKHQFDAVDMLWGGLIEIFGGKENADQIYMLASSR